MKGFLVDDENDYPDIVDQVAYLMRQKMKEKYITQRALAKKLNLSEPQISKFLSGKESSLKSSSIEKLFNALGYHPVISMTKVRKDS